MLVFGYKVNISFLTEKLAHSKICGTKVGPSYKNGFNIKHDIIEVAATRFISPIRRDFNSA